MASNPGDQKLTF